MTRDEAKAWVMAREADDAEVVVDALMSLLTEDRQALEAELREAVGLLRRAVKYVVEDQVVSPRATRLPRLTDEVSAWLVAYDERHKGEG